MRRLLGVVFIMVTLPAAPAMGESFDGNWMGQIPPSANCNFVATMTITVSGDTLSGLVHNRGNDVRAIKGSIDADGNATFTTQAGNPGRIKFTNDHFDANWSSGGCQRHSLGDRAPDTTQIAALIAQRQKAQATYDALTVSAAAGDKSVDFSLLRASYPFTMQWDPLSRTSAPIMEQAHAAAKGKDCVTALEKIDEVLKIDYTIIVAHRVRSDCLKGDAARVESRIADDLKDSLIHGGSGRSESTAYPVMTMHEEADVLGDKRIVLKSRDVEIRGSNGRYYDVVHGVSLWDGVRVQDVYFDVTAQVNGRNSAMTAAQAATATPP